MDNELKIVKLLDSINISVDADGLLNKYDATTAPTSTDDTNAGYSVGSVWIDVTADLVYQAVDVTASNAIWANLSASGTDINAKVSANDTTTGYLNGKLVAGTNVTLTELNDGGNETLQISATGGGAGAGASLQSAYDNVDTSATDPGSGKFKLNSGTPASVSQLYINDTTDNGADIGQFLKKMQLGELIYIQQSNDATKYLILETTGSITDNTGWWTVSVNVFDSSTIFDDEAECSFSITNPLDIYALNTETSSASSDRFAFQQISNDEVKAITYLNLKNNITSNSFRDDQSGEIAALTEKVSPVGADLLVIEDSAAGNAKKKVQITNLPGGGSSNSFETISTPAGTSPVADSATDTLTLTSADTKLTITGDSVADSIEFAVVEGNIDHDALTNFVANEHVDHSTVSINTTSPLTGGGDLTTTRTIDLDIQGLTGTAIDNADIFLFEDANDSFNPKKITFSSLNNSLDHDQLTNFDAAEHFTQAAISITASQVSDFNEASQDAIGGILTDSSTIDFTYDDVSNTITASTIDSAIDHDALLNFVANEHIDWTQSGAGTIHASNYVDNDTTDHTAFSNLAWTSSGHTGTATNLAGFNGVGAASHYTLSGTGTEVALTGGPTFTSAPSGLVTTSVDNTVPRFDGTGGQLQTSSVVISDTDAISGLTEITTSGKINLDPGSDTDITLLEVGVTGTPSLLWDESSDAFEFTHDLMHDTNATWNIANENSTTAAVNIGPRLVVDTDFTKTSDTPALDVSPTLITDNVQEPAIRFSPTHDINSNITAFGQVVGTDYLTVFDVASGFSSSNNQGMNIRTDHTGAGTLTNLTNMNNQITGQSGTITSANGATIVVGTTGTGTITTGVGLSIAATGPIFGGTVTNGTTMVLATPTATNKTVISQTGTGESTWAGHNNFDNGISVTGNWGFDGVTASATDTGWTTFTNLSTDKTCDANATNVAELADILGTLIEELKTKGILSA